MLSRSWLAAAAMAALIGAAHAEDYRVGELNAGPGGAFVFDPAIVRLAVGDTVTFVAVDQFHQVTTVIGGIPAGAEPFRSERNMDYTQAFTVPGIYVYECTSHRSLGMVGIVNRWRRCVEPRRAPRSRPRCPAGQ